MKGLIVFKKILIIIYNNDKILWNDILKGYDKMATKKYDKVKLGLPAYITFACFIVAIILMIILVIPSNKKKVRKMFSGSYQETTKQQGEEAQVKYYGLKEDHILKTYSFSNLKKQLKKDQYTYVIYGDYTNTDFARKVCDLNDLGIELGIKKIIYVNSKTTSKSQKEYLRDRIKKVNTDCTSVEKMPELDIWVFKNDTLIDCYSNPDYTELELSIMMVAKNHIFSYKNE